MATTKPRVTVTLTERQHEVLRAIGQMGGQSMSQMIGELVELSLPTLERMAATFQALHRAKQEERAKMLAAFDEAQSAIEPAVMQVAGQFDLFLGKLEAISGGDGAGEASEARAPAPAPKRIRPPSANRGVTTTSGKSAKAKSSKPSSPVKPRKVSAKS